MVYTAVHLNFSLGSSHAGSCRISPAVEYKDREMWARLGRPFLQNHPLGWALCTMQLCIYLVLFSICNIWMLQHTVWTVRVRYKYPYVPEHYIILFQDGVCDEISYSVSRLVQGLSSQRKFARLGYSVALCQVSNHRKNPNNSDAPKNWLQSPQNLNKVALP